MKFNTVLVLMIFGSLFNLLGCKSEPKALPEQAQTAQAIADENLAGSTYAVTLDGKPLKELPEPDSIKTQNKAKLDASRNFYLGHLDDVKSYVSYGAQNLKCGYVENAIQVLSKGIEQFSNTADLYLYRGIAFVQGRQFGPAVNDFWKAGKAVEGQKDVKGMLEKTEIEKKINAGMHYEIYKWMGLAFQCQNDFPNAEKMFEVCGDFSTNSDLYCMAYYWQYQAYSRSGRVQDAKNILESADPKMFIMPVTKPYLDALLYLKGSIKESELVNLDQLPTTSEEALAWTVKAYAIALKAELAGTQDKQIRVLEKIESSPFWNQMAYIAAEADLHRLKGFKYEEMKAKELKSNGKRNQ
ncbi:MAG: hypothetical protein V9E90_05545 [Saprospiraceae bacterium]|jgi:tetratricopeptide (TPR) repeat protein